MDWIKYIFRYLCRLKDMLYSIAIDKWTFIFYTRISQCGILLDHIGAIGSDKLSWRGSKEWCTYRKPQ